MLFMLYLGAKELSLAEPWPGFRQRAFEKNGEKGIQILSSTCPPPHWGAVSLGTCLISLVIEDS